MAASGGAANATEEAIVIPDDRLRLVFTCCHPSLALEAQVALTPRLLCGLTTATYGDTDWYEILGLYNAVLAVWPSPVVGSFLAPPLRGYEGGAALPSAWPE